jgi:hypothetical protein
MFYFLFGLPQFIIIGHLWTLPLWVGLGRVRGTQSMGQMLLESANLLLAVAACLELISGGWMIFEFLTGGFDVYFSNPDPVFGPWAPYVAAILLTGAIPQLLWIKRFRASAVVSLAIWFGVLGGRVLWQAFVVSADPDDGIPDWLPWMEAGWMVYLAGLAVLAMVRGRLQAQESLSGE